MIKCMNIYCNWVSDSAHEYTAVGLYNGITVYCVGNTPYNALYGFYNGFMEEYPDSLEQLEKDLYKSKAYKLKVAGLDNMHCKTSRELFYICLERDYIKKANTWYHTRLWND